MWSEVLEWFTVDRLSALIGVAAFLAGFLFWWSGYKMSRVQHRASEVARRESLEPMVIVDITPLQNERDAMVLLVKNIGPSVARNVRISASPPPTRSFDGPSEKPMSEWHIFTNGVPAMPPGYQMQYLFDYGSRRFATDLPTEFTFTVKTDGPFGPVSEMKYEVDLDVMRDAWVGQTTLRTLVDGIAKINSTLTNVTKAVERLNPEERRARRRNIENGTG